MKQFWITFSRGDSKAVSHVQIDAESESQAIQKFTDWADEQFADFGYDFIRATEVPS